MTFRTRILLTFLFLFTVSFSIVIVYFYRTTSRGIQEQTIAGLRADAVWTLNDLSEQLESLQMEMAAMATARVWYDNSPHEYRLGRLKAYQKIYPLFENIALYDKSGMVIGDSCEKNRGSLDKCLCWQEGISGKKGFHVVSERGSHDSVIHFYHGVINPKGQLTTVLTGRAPLSRIIRELRGVQKFPHSDFSSYLVELITADGKILYSIPNAPTVANETAGWSELKREIDRLNSQGEGSSIWSTNNALNILAVSEQGHGVAFLPWAMHIHVSKDLLFADIRNQGKKLSLLAVLMIGLSGLFIWIASARLSRPVRELSDLVHEIGKGNFDLVKTLPGRTDEFSGLVESMRMMGSRLEKALVALKEREKSARIDEKKFRTVADFTIAWEYWISQEGNFLYISPSCEKITGYSAAEFQRTPALLSQIVHPDDSARYDGHLAHSLIEPAEKNGVHDELEFRIITKRDELRWIGHVCRPVIDDNGRFLGRRVSNRDITDSKKFEAMISKLNEELEAKVISRTAELERTINELESFCYAISHEIRAPLARLEGFSKVLEEETALEGNEQSRFHAERLTASSLQLRDVIDGLLLFTRLSRTEVRRQPVDLSELTTQLVADLSAKETERKPEFVIARGVSAIADSELISICLRGLLENAVKFTVGTPSPVIEFGILEARGEIVYFVRDNGAGFDMSYTDKLFIPFQRLHSQKEFAGTGLGLATAKRVIELHDGKIWAESQHGKGTTFYFTLNDSTVTAL